MLGGRGDNRKEHCVEARVNLRGGSSLLVSGSRES